MGLMTEEKMKEILAEIKKRINDELEITADGHRADAYAESIKIIEEVEKEYFK